jgi:NDP-sugar pyrophosphorylase family protein
MADQIIAHVGDGSNWEVPVSYSVETEPMGTGGALKGAYLTGLLKDTFVVVYGDSLVEMTPRSVMTALELGRASAVVTKWNDEDYGIYALRREVVAHFPIPSQLDVELRKVGGYVLEIPVEEKFLEIGSPEGLAEMEEALKVAL